jgi:hypothetical protein
MISYSLFVCHYSCFVFCYYMNTNLSSDITTVEHTRLQWRNFKKHPGDPSSTPPASIFSLVIIVYFVCLFICLLVRITINDIKVNIKTYISGSNWRQRLQYVATYLTPIKSVQLVKLKNSEIFLTIIDNEQ